MVVLVAIDTAIVCLNMVFQIAGLLIATEESYVRAFGTEGANALVLLMFDMQHYGYLIAQIFFGLWLSPLGYLVKKSGMFPKLLSTLLIAGGACYLVGTLAEFLVPTFAEAINGFIYIPPILAEVWILLYLLVKGVKSAYRNRRTANMNIRPDDGQDSAGHWWHRRHRQSNGHGVGHDGCARRDHRPVAAAAPRARLAKSVQPSAVQVEVFVADLSSQSELRRLADQVLH